MRDTSPDASTWQTRVQRRLTGQDRLRQALEMSLFARELAATRLRAAHPDWSGEDVTRELLRYAFLGHPVPPPLR